MYFCQLGDIKAVLPRKKTREIGNSNCFKLGLNEVQMLSCAC